MWIVWNLWEEIGSEERNFKCIVYRRSKVEHPSIFHLPRSFARETRKVWILYCRGKIASRRTWKQHFQFLNRFVVCRDLRRIWLHMQQNDGKTNLNTWLKGNIGTWICPFISKKIEVDHENPIMGFGRSVKGNRRSAKIQMEYNYCPSLAPEQLRFVF